MELKQALLSDLTAIEKRGYRVPQFDVSAVAKETKEQPTWLQLGAGNIFRAFLAANQQHLLNQGLAKTGIIVVEGYDYEIVDILAKYDDLTVNVTLKENGEVEKEILASISEYLKMATTEPDYARLKEILRAPSLQMVSLTITEKGYSLVDNSGEIAPAVQTDFEKGPKQPISYIGKLVALLFERFQAGQLPLALVSMDNMSHNGEKLQASVTRFAKEWAEREFVPQAFVDYLVKGDKVTFPWSMIDKITPRPDATVQGMLEEDGLVDMAPTETSKHTFVAPYVNGEETQYLVIEDAFPNGRPDLAATGIIFTDRKTVNAVETMKVTTCLNPLHTALAIFGCLLGFTSIHSEMQDADLVELIKRLGYDEGLPVVTDPKILDPKEFIDQVIDVRLPNPFIPDTPQRIATDTSQKLAVRFGETVKAYLKSETLDVHSLKVIPLVYAGWLRYLTGVNDYGEEFSLSPDPLMPKLTPILADYHFGQQTITKQLSDLLHDQQIFGVDLYQAELADEVLELFNAMSSGKGAVRNTIRQVLAVK